MVDGCSTRVMFPYRIVTLEKQLPHGRVMEVSQAVDHQSIECSELIIKGSIFPVFRPRLGKSKLH